MKEDQMMFAIDDEDNNTSEKFGLHEMTVWSMFPSTLGDVTVMSDDELCDEGRPYNVCFRWRGQ